MEGRLAKQFSVPYPFKVIFIKITNSELVTIDDFKQIGGTIESLDRFDIYEKIICILISDKDFTYEIINAAPQS